MDNNEQYKLKTRRWLAWGVGGIAVVTICFIAVWGTVSNITELVTLAAGILGTALGSVIAFYFSKKVSEE